MNYFLNEKQNDFFVKNMNTWSILLIMALFGAGVMGGVGLYTDSALLLLVAVTAALTFSIGAALFGYLKEQAALRLLIKNPGVRGMNGDTAVGRLMNGLEAGDFNPDNFNLDDGEFESLVDEAFDEMENDLTGAEDKDDYREAAPEPNVFRVSADTFGVDVGHAEESTSPPDPTSESGPCAESDD